MKWTALMSAGFIVLTMVGCAAESVRTHFPATRPPPSNMAIPSGSKPPFSAAVLAGSTLYVSGAIDVDPNTGRPGTSAEESSRFALDALKNAVETAGMTTDDLVWVQVFCTDLNYFPTFNTVYRTYFSGELPARAFLGVDHLLGNGHFEVMGIAVRQTK
jgi:2-iminobutanoate/2-iminopropanoate deaminase